MELIYDAQEDYTKSLKLRKKMLKLVIEINDSIEIARSYHNLGVSYSQNEMLDSALFCYNKSLEIRQLLGDEYGVAKSIINIATAYFSLEKPQYEQAIKLLLEAEETFQKINNKPWLVHTQSLLANA
ncbi:tetratricopeptide repeat protein [Saprospiraceae bacterium]|jgi:tetratricopeptide (TPR) repeat protein|nr:tetratricopeptide repeat protein [Saprospiraceae bacterium]